jgi:hypothetical protein
MLPHRVVSLCALAGLAFVSACGGGSGSKSGASGPGTVTSSTTSAGGSQSTTANPSRAASIDVCSLLTEADAADVAGKAQLGGAGATYKLTATKVDQTSSIPTSACKFGIDAYSGGSVVSGGVVEMDVTSADNFAAYKNGGTPIPGLGDEAVSSSGVAVVRVGDLMLQTGEDTLTQSFVVELYRKMVPKLK